MSRTAKQIATELLVLRVQNSEQAAWEDLVREWTPILHGYCHRYLRNAADIQDIVQQVWIKAMRGIGKLRDPACFPAWLLRITHLTCIDTIRRQSQRGNLTEALIEQSDCEPETPTDNSAEMMDLREAIAALPPGQQGILSLHYTLGFSTGEIAHILGIAQGTVKSRLHSARQILKTKLETGENHE